MKLLAISIGLFFGFASAQLGVKWLDAYSEQYLACAQKHWEQVDQAGTDPYRQASVIKSVKNPTHLRVNDRPCPVLRQAHADMLINTLTTK